MSEFQYVGFRAIDAPVSAENLQFMRQQSSRAEITPRSFDNEYHYGDFGGNAAEMLRRGYDFHFHYANFGVRTLMIRLPDGLPDPKAAKPYFLDDSLSFLKDKQGRGGILGIEPCYEPGDLDDLWGLEEFFERLLPLRAEILDGDLRPLYLAHLGVAKDMNHDPQEEPDAPVPAGLDQLTPAQQALAELYGIDEALLAAAAQNSPALPDAKDPRNEYATWLQDQPDARKTAWLAQLMAEPHSSVRRELLAEFQKGRNTTAWPTVAVDRTIADLQQAAEEIHQELKRRKAEQAARQRAKRLADIAADPQRVLRETEELVKQRSTHAYEEIAGQLAELREALAGSKQADLAEQQARQLNKKNPKLHILTSALRKKGFLKK